MEQPICIRCKQHHSQYPDPEQLQHGNSFACSSICSEISTPQSRSDNNEPEHQLYDPHQETDTAQSQPKYTSIRTNILSPYSTPYSRSDAPEPEKIIELEALNENGKPTRLLDCSFHHLPTAAPIATQQPRVDKPIIEAAWTANIKELVILDLIRIRYACTIDGRRYRYRSHEKTKRMEDSIAKWIRRKDLQRIINRDDGLPEPGPTDRLQPSDEQIVFDQKHIEEILQQALEIDDSRHYDDRIHELCSKLADQILASNVDSKLQPLETNIMNCVDEISKSSDRRKSTIAGRKSGRHNIVDDMHRRINRRVAKQLEANGIAVKKTTNQQEDRKKRRMAFKQRKAGQQINAQKHTSSNVFETSGLAMESKLDERSMCDSRSLRNKFIKPKILRRSIVMELATVFIRWIGNNKALIQDDGAVWRAVSK